MSSTRKARKGPNRKQSGGAGASRNNSSPQLSPLQQIRSHPPDAATEALCGANQKIEQAILLRLQVSARLGEKLREKRECMGFSLRELARLAGVSPMYLSDLERGRRIIGELLWVRLWSFL